MTDESKDCLGWSINWIEEWSQFFEPCNWYTFEFIKFEVEDDRHLGGIEATLVLLGLGFRLRYCYAVTEDMRELRRRVAAIEAGNDLLLREGESIADLKKRLDSQ